jgi:WD40 repeat protein
MAMKEEPKDIKTIFSEALEKKDVKERAEYLDKVCGNDAALRAKVEALLKANEQAGSFLNAPPFDPNVTLDTSPLTEGPGTIIGRYKLLEQIGEGGFGVVYMAEQQEPIRRRVALKIIKLGMDTRQVIARFEAERQALAMMDHPNIAGVLDAGATDTGRPYFVMELVKGIPITEYCDKNNLDTQQRLELFIDVCKAVQHAHQKGIIHRDIKPSNVMITLHDGKPVPKVIDFGIAKATGHRLTEKTLFTKYAQMIGTPEYMSPEQAEMSGLDIDTRTDIYSLGVLLYELLTSATPFDAKELREAGYIQMQRIIRETEPLRPSTKLNTMGDALTDIAKHRQSSPALLPKLVRGDLDWIAMKTLEKDRTRRYETANELAMDIQRHLSNEPVEASPPSTLYRFRKLVQKHRRTVAAVATIIVTLIIGLGVSTSMYFLANRARRSETVARSKAEQSQKAEQEQRKLAETKAEDLRRSSYVNNIQLADSKYREGNISRMHELLNSCPNDLRGWEWNRLNYICDQSVMTLRGHDGVFAVIFSPDGKRVISGGNDGIIKVWDSATGKELKILRGHEGLVGSLAISRDGRRIVSGSWDKTIRIWDSETGDEVKTIRGHKGIIYSVALSIDGKLIASTDMGENVVRVWNVGTGAELMTLGGYKGHVRQVAFSPDGKRIVSSDDSGEMKFWDAATGKELMTVLSDIGFISWMVFSPDGKKIASVGIGWDPVIKVWDSESGKLIMTIHGQHARATSVAFSPDGKYIANGNSDNMIKIWDAETGEELKTFRGHEWTVWDVAFSPNGKWIVSGSQDGTVKLWDVTTGREGFNLHRSDEVFSRYESDFPPGFSHAVTSIAFRPDGKRIASASLDRTIKLWDVKTGAELATLQRQGTRVVFSPDGKRIAAGGCERAFKIWDAETGAEVLTLSGHEGLVGPVAFSQDGKIIASGGSGDKTIKVWNAASGEQLMSLTGHEDEVISIAISPDCRHIASGDYNSTIKVWDAANGDESITLRGHEGPVASVVFSPDGKRIISGSYDRTVKIWDAETGTELMTLHGHGDLVFSVALSPDGERLVTGGQDGTAKMWDSRTGAELLTLRADCGFSSVAFSPDGKTIATGTGDGSILLWESAEPDGGYEPRRKGTAARELVDNLYKKNGFYHDAIDKLEGDKTLDEAIQKVALQIANSRKWEDAEKLKERSWEVVRLPDKDAESYKSALEKAEKANILEPNDPSIFNLLGAAQYRVGSYEDALKTLTKTDKIRTDTDEGTKPANLAFTAMALHKLGRAEEAKVTLDRLRILLKDERFAQDEQAKALLAEAEKLIEGEK